MIRSLILTGMHSDAGKLCAIEEGTALSHNNGAGSLPNAAERNVPVDESIYFDGRHYDVLCPARWPRQEQG